MEQRAHREQGLAPDSVGDRSSVGTSLSSGFRSREKAMSPASGVRSAPGQLRPPEPGEAPLLRHPLDSEVSLAEVTELTELTEIGLPDPSLLALSREAPSRQAMTRTEPSPALGVIPRAGWYGRVVWFLLGVAVGGVSVWAATNDVPADVYRARLWVASTLRSVRAHAIEDVPVATGAAVTPAPPAIPTVDVTQLPRAREEQVQPPGTTPAPPPPAPGAPALPHAPGPR